MWIFMGGPASSGGIPKADIDPSHGPDGVWGGFQEDKAILWQERIGRKSLLVPSMNFRWRTWISGCPQLRPSPRNLEGSTSYKVSDRLFEAAGAG